MEYKFGLRAYVCACILGFVGHAVGAHPVAAQPADTARLPDQQACLPGILAAERQYALPPKLLQTIGIVESGRPDPASGPVAPWPWTINAGGVGHFFATKASAIEAVQDLQKAGTNSVDVGCMQINLVQHPDAFASLDEAFDPQANTRYGARFLAALYREIGNWPQAAAAYHSRTEDLGVSYETRVMALWPLADRFPDATLALRRHAVSSEPDLIGYTPQFVAEMQRMRAEVARLTAMSGPVVRTAHHPAGPDYSRYTPAFVAALRRTAHFAAGHATAVALNMPLPRHAGAARPASGSGGYRAGASVRVAGAK